MNDTLYTKQLEQYVTMLEEALPTYLPQSDTFHEPVSGAMSYACAEGGKRIRPVLLMEFCRICAGDVKAALPFACAMEMIHSYSLVHDDLPCMDNSPLRRGKPSVHAAYGEDMALLAGDALLNRAFETMLSRKSREGFEASVALEAASLLADAAGIRGMVGGQVIDLRSEGQNISLETLERLQEGKTSALLTAACEMGCVLGMAGDTKRLAARTYGRCVGLSFQIVDDILDAVSTADMLGKPVGSDEDNHKATYVTLLGVDKARALAQERTAEAISALSVFGDEADGLRKLAQALLTRKK